MNQSNSIVVSLLAMFVVLIGCGDPAQQGQDVKETALAGRISVLVDPEILPMMNRVLELYAREHPDANVSFEPVPAQNALLRMLQHESRVAVVARGYTPSEDSSIANDPGDTLPRSLLGRDALVFFTSKEFPYDTMNADHIRQWLSGRGSPLQSYRMLSKDPTFVVSGGSVGSIYGNVINVVLSGKEPLRVRVASLPTHDSVVAAIVKTKSSIGIGYLSQLGEDTSVKALRLSYTSSDGEHVWPKPVHASYVALNQYPFPVPIYVYLRDRPNMYNLPSGFMQFITRNAEVMKSLLQSGIVPGYGNITLVMPE